MTDRPKDQPTDQQMDMRVHREVTRPERPRKKNKEAVIEMLRKIMKSIILFHSFSNHVGFRNKCMTNKKKNLHLDRTLLILLSLQG